MTAIAPVSVCLATHDGADFVADQVRSILAQLDESDEVVVVDDASTDETVAVLRDLGDARLRITENPCNLGYVRTFERALGLAGGEHVFLSDQDDVWPRDRVRVMQEALLHSAVVAGNVAILGGPDHLRSPFGATRWVLDGDPSRHPLPWLLRLAASNAPYFGSAMAVRADLLRVALPFPDSVQELHDAWLALLGLHTGSITHLPDRVVLRRLHAGNASGRRRAWPDVIRGRVLFLRMWRDARRRTRALPRQHP